MSCRGQSWVSSVDFSTTQDEIEDDLKNIAEKIVEGLDLLKLNYLATIAMIGNQLFRMIVRINLISILGHELHNRIFKLVLPDNCQYNCQPFIINQDRIAFRRNLDWQLQSSIIELARNH